jgi:hypothetical protein
MEKKDEPVIRIFKLENRNVNKLGGAFFHHIPLKMTADTVTNSLVAQGTPNELAVLEAFLKELDVAPNTAQERGGVGLPPVSPNQVPLYQQPMETIERTKTVMEVVVEEQKLDDGTVVQVQKTVPRTVTEYVQVPPAQNRESFDVVHRKPTELVVHELDYHLKREGEEPTFVTYPVSEDHEWIYDVIATFRKEKPSDLNPRLGIDKGTNILFAVGNKAEHEQIRDILAMFKRGKEHGGTPVAEDALIAKIYAQPDGVNKDFDFSNFVKSRLAGSPNTWVIRASNIARQVGIVSAPSQQQFVVVGHQSAHDTVREMFEQIKKARE